MIAGSVDVYVDSSELDHLRLELLALSQELSWVESRLAYSTLALGGIEAEEAIGAFRSGWSEARRQLAQRLTDSAEFVRVAIEQYTYTENLLRSSAESEAL